MEGVLNWARPCLHCPEKHCNKLVEGRGTILTTVMKDEWDLWDREKKSDMKSTV